MIGTRERSGKDFHHQGKGRPFGIPDGNHRSAQRRHGVRGRPARRIQSPTFGDRLTPLFRAHDLAPRHFAQGHIDHQRMLPLPRTAKG